MKINFKYLTFLFLVAFFVSPNFTNAQYSASDLLGQLDGSDNPLFTTNVANNGAGFASINNKGITFPRGMAIDLVNHRLFFTDRNNLRVLIFNLDDDNNLIDRVADNVLGQATFDVNVSATTQSNFLSVVQGVIYDPIHNRLFVTDSTANRVLVFDTSIITDGMNASYVLGQSDFVTATAATTQSGLSNPTGGAYDQNNNRLFINDTNNNRVLVYDVSTITNGMNASYVLGQPDFTSNTAATTQAGMSAPNTGGVYDIDNNRLFVSDSVNRRILVFDVASITNGENATHVLGQTLFTTSTNATTQNGFGQLRGIDYDSENKQLFIADDQNNSRVLIYNVDPDTITNGQNAVAVIGQVDFISGVTGTTQTNLSRLTGVSYDPNNNRIYVPDLGNNRIMIFNFVKLSTTNPPDATQNTVYSQSLTTTNSQGTVSYAITEGSLPTGLSLNTTTGEISGTPTTAGSYDFTVQATDDNGAIGYFLSQPQEYTLVVEEPRSNTSGSRPKSRTNNVPVVTEYTPTTVVELTTPANTLNLTRTLRIKDSGEDVKELQKCLNTHGYPVAITGPGSLGNETTKFGLLTHAAVIKFQLANNLVPDGIVGPLTRGVMK